MLYSLTEERMIVRSPGGRSETARILKIASDKGTTNTEIMMKMSLPRTDLMQRLWQMTSDGLLEYDRERKKYLITESGKRLLYGLPLAADA